MSISYDTLVQRRGTTSQWTASTRALLSGEFGLDTTTREIKIGNGTDLWAALPVAALGEEQTAALVAADIGNPATEIGAAAAATIAPVATAAGTAAAAVRVVSIDIPQHRIALRKWYAHLANRDIAPAQVIVRGDSIGEGTGATLTMRRWQQVLQKRLRTQLGITYGADVPYITAALAVTPTIADYPSAVGSGASSAEMNGGGLGNRARYSQVSGYTRVFTAKMTSAKLLYETDTDTLIQQYYLDGNSGTPIPYSSVASGSRVNSLMFQVATGLDGASHTVTVRRSTGMLRVEGLIVYNGDENSGLRIYDASHHGTQTDRLIGAQALADRTAQAQLGTIGLNIVGMGTNDINSGVTAATFKANNLTYISEQRAAGFDGSFIFYLPATLTSNPLRAQYMTALREIEAGDPDVLVVDWFEKLPTGSLSASGLGLYADVFHNSDKGHAYVADFFTQILIPN